MSTLAVIVVVLAYVSGSAVIWACLLLASSADEQLVEMGLLGGNN